MNRAVALLFTLAATSALIADAPKAEPVKESPPAAASSTAGPAQVDSPLVAAAKRANRLTRKSGVVITNETLRSAGAGAHVTTTESQPEIKVAATPKPDAAVQAALARRAVEEKKRRDRLEAAKKKVQEDRQRRLGESAESAEDGYYVDEEHDPSQSEKRANDAADVARKPPHD